MFSHSVHEHGLMWHQRNDSWKHHHQTQCPINNSNEPNARKINKYTNVLKYCIIKIGWWQIRRKCCVAHHTLCTKEPGSHINTCGHVLHTCRGTCTKDTNHEHFLLPVHVYHTLILQLYYNSTYVHIHT